MNFDLKSPPIFCGSSFTPTFFCTLPSSVSLIDRSSTRPEGTAGGRRLRSAARGAEQCGTRHTGGAALQEPSAGD